jgi:hypothetical protein
LVKLGEIDNLLQTVMFTLYGNQYEPSEEHLLLSLFKQVLEKEFESGMLAGRARAHRRLAQRAISVRCCAPTRPSRA